MRFAFTEEQDMLRDMIRGALQREVAADKVRRWSDAADSAPFNAIVERNGWSGLGIAEESGGQGGGAIEQALLFEEFGRCAAPTGVALATLAGVLGFAAAGDCLAALGAVTSGEQIGVLAVSACSPADLGVDSVVQKQGKLTGVVPMVLSAPAAQQILVPLAGKEGLELWLVAASADGLRINPRHLIDRTRQFGDVSLEATPATLIGRIGQAAAAEANARLALLLAAESLGLARRMLEMTVEYVGQRVQFGVPVGSFQAVKHSAAEALVEIEAAHSGVYYGAWALQEREPDGVMTAWIAKAFATEMAARTADRALLLHGAIGYTWEHDLQIYYKHAKLNLELFGSPKLYRERIAASLLHVETTSH